MAMLETAANAASLSGGYANSYAVTAGNQAYQNYLANLGNILPALFGPLAVVYVSKNWRVAMAPLVFMVVLFVCVPSLASSVGVLVPVGAIIAIAAARILYKKGLV